MFVAGLQFKYFHVGYSYDIGTGPEEPGPGPSFIYTHEFSYLSTSAAIQNGAQQQTKLPQFLSPSTLIITDFGNYY